MQPKANMKRKTLNREETQSKGEEREDPPTQDQWNENKDDY